MKRNLTSVLPIVALAMTMNVCAQRGGPRGYDQSEVQAYAIWQSVEAGSAAARSAQTTMSDAPKIKICVGYRARATAYLVNLASTRVYLVEHENGRIRKFLSESVFASDSASPDGKPVAAAPFWCFFSERTSPPPNVSVADGNSRLDAAIYIRGPHLEYNEQPASADLNRMMLDWVR
jgi:hypothetical protein